MEDRILATEKAISELLKSQVNSNVSVAGSMEKIAKSLDQLNAFQTATETHRQHDVAFRSSMNKKLDNLMEHREKDLNDVFKEMRINNKNILIVEKDHQELKNDFDAHILKDEKLGDRIRNMFGVIFTGGIIAGFTFWLKHK